MAKDNKLSTKLTMLRTKLKVISVIFLVFVVKVAFCQSVDSTLTIGEEAFSLIKKPDVQKGIKESLTGFLNNLYKGSINNPFIDPDYLRKNKEPFEWLIAYDDEAKAMKYKIDPTVISVLPVENSSYLIKLEFMNITNVEKAKLGIIVTVIAKMIGPKYYFYNALDHYTQFWGKQKVGTINYIYPTKLNLKNANAMNKFNIELAHKFNAQPLQINYYKFADPEQLFKTIGFDYIPNMYYSTSGGLAEPWTNTLYAGNNSELYEHEAVHFYTAALFPNRSKIVDEGYATYLGGSGGKSLDELAMLAKNYIKTHPAEDVLKLSTDFTVRVEGNVPITYILSALVCRDVEKKYGIKGIRKMFSPEKDKDYFKTLYRVNKVNRGTFSSYVNELLQRY